MGLQPLVEGSVVLAAQVNLVLPAVEREGPGGFHLDPPLVEVVHVAEPDHAA